MSELIAYLNGEYIPVSQCKISVMDIGVTTGASVTDMVRTFTMFRKILKAWGERVGKDLWTEITDSTPIVYR